MHAQPKDTVDETEVEDRGDLFARDEQGRFAASDTAETDTAKTDVAETDAAETDAAETDAAETDAAERDLTAEEIRKQNYPVRLKKALSQRDAEMAARETLEQELATIRAKLEAQSETVAPKVDPLVQLNEELDVLYTQVEEARADGDAKQAAQLQRQIDVKNRAIVRAEATTQALSATEERREVALYNRMLDHLEAVYPQLVKGTEEYTPELVAELQDAAEAFEAKGYPVSQALRKATLFIFREDPFAAPPSRAEAKKAPAPKKSADVTKALDTARRQPASAKDVGLTRDSEVIRVEGLSDDEFAALPESKKRELRGDYV